MTRKEALEALRDKVKVGRGIEYEAYRKAFDGIDGRPAEMDFPILRDGARLAFLGSLDAAKALHDAVLHGWHFNVATEANLHGFYATVSPKHWGNSCVACSENPARAWLLAIIKALIAEETK